MTGTLYLFSSALEADAAFGAELPAHVSIATTGVGLVDAAIGTARLVTERAPERIVFIGTCGAHRRSGIAVGDIVVASSVRLGSGDVARGEMRIPSLLPSEVGCDVELALRLASRIPRAIGHEILTARVSCTLGVTENDALAEALEVYDSSQVENLEAFSVARAAGTIPVAIILGVTNSVGAGGGRQWKENHAGMMRLLSHCIEPAPIQHTA